MTIKTYDEINAMKDSSQKSALYELHFLNLELLKYNKKAVLLKQSACYTHHIAVDIIPLENETSWYEASNKRYFKNWIECFKYLEGMRDVFYKHVLKD
jgi:hypothetical protein